ncbi:hypothetical protein EAW52_10975 [Pseudomonas sp. LTJR-52]|uniref:hypothetical protein n=1 Tax=Pseudomonas sp. LTJR-52 TaxID=2479392 RepID=UPI000EFC3653|nr:hypothetical protein [Pseudomonas sp. LTJR-52]AYN94445.1 hypothetical protein EAW52_10975 [Pseudomonas sp. LTJR-52]
MSEQKIQPHQVTKPIQLLAAWLVGLVLINGSFLGAAKVINTPAWVPGVLVVAAILNVPIFLYLIFSLQTKFRAELQEDTFYSKHLEKVTGKIKVSSYKENALAEELKKAQEANLAQFKILSDNLEYISSALNHVNDGDHKLDPVLDKVAESKSAINSLEKIKEKAMARIALNDLLPHYNEIRFALIKNGFSVERTFGSNNEDKVLPKELTISYTPDASKAALVEVYSVAKLFGFNRLDFDCYEYEISDSHIYVGSYIDSFTSSRSSVLVDAFLERALLDNDVTKESFNSLLRSLAQTNY